MLSTRLIILNYNQKQFVLACNKNVHERKDLQIRNAFLLRLNCILSPRCIAFCM